jgi:hypothetical protein
MTSALHNIKDIIFSQHLMADDVVKRMKLRLNQPALNRKQLAEALNRIDFNLNFNKALQLADSLLKDKKQIPVKDLL